MYRKRVNKWYPLSKSNNIPNSGIACTIARNPHKKEKSKGKKGYLPPKRHEGNSSTNGYPDTVTSQTGDEKEHPNPKKKKKTEKKREKREERKKDKGRKKKGNKKPPPYPLPVPTGPKSEFGNYLRKRTINPHFLNRITQSIQLIQIRMATGNLQ